MEKRKVIIVGGGIAGMSAAQELLERNTDHVQFDIHIYEKEAQYVGGKARSIPVLTRPGKDGVREGYEAADWEVDGKWALPGEHGFRFFPGFYKHLPDTMSRIPCGESGTVAEKLVPAHYVELALYGRKPIIAATRLPSTLGELIEDLKALFLDRYSLAGLGLTRDEVDHFGKRMWQILTSCSDRRLASYEKTTWWDFLDADKHSRAYQNLFARGLSRSLLANDPTRASARTVGDTNIQLFFNMAEFRGTDRLLNGPTSEVWLHPWRKYLKGESGKQLACTPVTFHMGRQAVRILCEGGKVSGIRVRDDERGKEEEEVTGDIYVFCLPVEKMADLLEQSRRADGGQDPLKLDPSLENICRLKSCVARMNGIQFFLKKDVPVVEGHILFVESPWEMTAISEMQFWSKNVDIERCDDGQVRGILSACISEWNRPGLPNWGKPPLPPVQRPPANESSREQIRREAWEQLKQGINASGDVQIEDSDLHSWFLDPDVADDPSQRGKYTDLEPLFVNETGTWSLRPTATTAIPNLFLASDYLQTYTDVACMEAANEAARRAANGILDACGSDAPRCELWNLHEPDLFRPFRREDQRRFDAGLPWNGELVRSGWSGETPHGKYIERSGMQCHLQPFDCNDITMFGFFVEGTTDNLQKLVDRSLNQPTAGATDYRVILPFVLITFAYVAKGTSTQEPDRSMGYVPETSCTLWITTTALEKGSADRLAMFVPYIVVDNAWSMAAGREIYGFPKEIGTFEMPKAIEKATRFSVATTVLPTFSPDTPATVKTLLEIERSGSAPPGLAVAWEGVEMGIEGLLGALGAGGGAEVDLPSHLLDDLINHKVPAVFLKQFRDAVDGRLASYQAIIETAVRVTNFVEGGLLDGAYTCRVNEYASHPMLIDLGLKGGLVPAAVPFYLKYSFEAGNGAEIWRAGPRKKIAVLGGGAGAMSAVYDLTEAPGWQDRYEITVYQMGWRLGGKGASGRNQDVHERIEEHGLHLWFGYYENAFNLMRRCYKALGREPGAPLSTWDKAFRPHGEIVTGEFHDERWSLWSMPLPEEQGYGEPGDGTLPTLWQWLERLVGALVAGVERHAPAELRREGPVHHGLLSEILETLGEEVVGEIEHSKMVEPIAAKLGIKSVDNVLMLRVAQNLIPVIEKYLEEWAEEKVAAALKKMVACVEHYVSATLDKIEGLLGSLRGLGTIEDDLRRLAEILELGWVNLKGIIEDDVITEGFEHLNGYDYREWLKKWGGTSLSVDSDIVRAAYESIFAYEDGDTERPNLAAGVALYGLLRLFFGWKGAVMWKMEAGMGDTVFAPLYLVLRDRGVKFKFFHKVKQLVLSEDKACVESIRIGQQADLNVKKYEPLRTVKALPCWPSRPLFDQIVQGPELKSRGIDLESAWVDWEDRKEITLRRGLDFDEIILGIPVGAFPTICKELIDANDSWKQMVEHVATVQTQAFQVWTAPSLSNLGWKVPESEPSRTPVLGGYAQPQNTWADMSHLIEREDWPADHPPGSIAYFCGPMQGPAQAPPATDRDFPEREAARVKDIAVRWIRDNLSYLWPEAARYGLQAHETFDWSKEVWNALKNRRAGGHPFILAVIGVAGDYLGYLWRALLRKVMRFFGGTFDWQVLLDLRENPGAGARRFDYQFWRANVDPSERYVLSTKGSIKYRLKSGESGFGNLYLAGDWTHNGLNIGCVEAAVTSGKEAAQAISGHLCAVEAQTEAPAKTGS